MHCWAEASTSVQIGWGVFCLRREAAAKLNINRKIIVRDCALRSGVFTDVTGINGAPHYSHLA